MRAHHYCRFYEQDVLDCIYVKFLALARSDQLVQILIHLLHDHMKKSSTRIVERLEDFYNRRVRRQSVQTLGTIISYFKAVEDANLDFSQLETI